MESNGLRSIAGQLLYGGSESTDRVAHDLATRNDPHMWALLVDTIQSDEGLPLKIRCLEVLAKAAASGSDETARQVLAALGMPYEDRATAGSPFASAR
jgi:hypothetical protein